MTAPSAGSGEDDAALAASLFAVDPAGLGGVVVRGAAGPERDAWLARLRALLRPDAPVGRAPLGIADDRLLGGLDLPATLAAGRPVTARGVLAAHHGGVVVLPMAERIDEGTAARVAAVLDSGEVVLEREGLAARLPARLGLVLLDEGRDEERPPPALTERLAFPRVEAGRSAVGADAACVQRARAALAETVVPDEVTAALCAAAMELGVASLRPPLLAVRAARAHAALYGRVTATEEDACVAARLVLLPRARVAPEAEAEAEPAPAPPEEVDASAEGDDTAEAPSDPEAQAVERMVEAVRAALPADLLARVVADNARSARAASRSGGGARAKSARRGRPVGSRAGALRPGDRLDIPATLRTAAPWRRLRAAGAHTTGRLPVRAEDFRIRRFVQRREATTIFVVDASGSSALQRLAETKGAVELLLARAYVSRDRVALVAFRGVAAEVLLPPTRSLTLARRRLADLPGGGGTPLARGLDAGLALALGERARERTPLLVVLTDGRTNIDRDGAPGRAAAERDALAAATRIGEAGVGAAYLDVSPRPQPGGDRFARAMGAVYAPLPYADAGRVSAAVDGARRRG